MLLVLIILLALCALYLMFVCMPAVHRQTSQMLLLTDLVYTLGHEDVPPGVHDTDRYQVIAELRKSSEYSFLWPFGFTKKVKEAERKIRAVPNQRQNRLQTK